MSLHPLNDIDAYEAKNKQKPSEILMKAMGFSENDLAANHIGIMSNRQRFDFYNRRNIWAMAGIVCMLGFFMLWIGGRDQSLPLLLFGIGIVVCGLNVYSRHIDAARGEVAVLEGRINLNINGRNFSVVIDDRKFALKQKVFLAFKNGDPYRVYYTPHTKKLLSAEWLRD